MTLKQINRTYCRFADKLRNSLEPADEGKHIMPLSKTCKGGRKRICKINGDRKLCARMANLGVYPGKEVEVICSEKGSQCVLKVHGGNISLDHETSGNILVQSL